MFVRPSRRVPGTVKLGLIIGGRATFFGWFLIGLGMCFVWSYGGDNLLRDWGLSTTRRSLFAVTFIPIVGVILVLRGMLKALKNCYLLAHGTLTSGTLIAKTPTLEMDHNRRIYKFVFSFRADDGTTHKVNARAPLSERPGSRIAYDARNPRKAVLLDDLPGRLGINERNEVTTATPAWLALLLVGPAAIVVVGHVYWALHVCEIL
jgi:hypothetical protein